MSRTFSYIEALEIWESYKFPTITAQAAAMGVHKKTLMSALRVAAIERGKPKQRLAKHGGDRRSLTKRTV